MRAKVYGQIGDGPVLTRTVTLRELVEEWGRYSMAVFHARRSHPLVVGDRRVWIELVA